MIEMPEDNLKVVVKRRRCGKTHDLCKIALAQAVHGLDVVYVVRNSHLVKPAIEELVKMLRKYTVSFETKYADSCVLILGSGRTITFMSHHTFLNPLTWKEKEDYYECSFKISDNLESNDFNAISINGTLA